MAQQKWDKLWDSRSMKERTELVEVSAETDADLGRGYQADLAVEQALRRYPLADSDVGERNQLHHRYWMVYAAASADPYGVEDEWADDNSYAEESTP